MTGTDRRGFLLGAAAAAGCATTGTRFDAVVGAGGVAAAIAAAPGDRPWQVLVPAGRWREKLVITKPNVTLIGEDRLGSILTYDDAARTPGPDGRNIGTSGSFSVAVRAPNFSAYNLTIENAFDYDGVARAAGGDLQAAGAMQAVALMLGEGSDCAHFENCEIIGHQDTLFTNVGRASFRHCGISGTVDFIFGGARAYFDRCEIISRARPDASVDRVGWVAAPSTQASQEFGLVFESCRLIREDGVPDWSVGLARFWRPTRTWPDGRRYGDPNAVGQVAFLRCWMDGHIIPQGFDPMGYNAEGGGRAMLTPEETRPGEYASNGPGAAPRGFQLSAEQARRFTRAAVLGDWRPSRA